MTEQMQDRLNQVFRDVFDDDTIEARPGMTAADIEGWDSMTHVRLLLNIERKFGVHFSAIEIGRLQSVEDLAKLIESKLSS